MELQWYEFVLLVLSILAVFCLVAVADYGIWYWFTYRPAMKKLTAPLREQRW